MPGIAPNAGNRPGSGKSAAAGPKVHAVDPGSESRTACGYWTFGRHPKRIAESFHDVTCGNCRRVRGIKTPLP